LNDKFIKPNEKKITVIRNYIFALTKKPSTTKAADDDEIVKI
jgi:hypothetical protein